MKSHLEAGQELDALVAQAVMGWTYVDRSNADVVRTKPNSSIRTPLPHYSTDVAAAWEVVRKLQGLNYIVRLWSPNEYSTSAHVPAGEWECAVWKFVDAQTGKVVSPLEVPRDCYEEITATGRAPTASLAICLAALEVVGIDPNAAAPGER